MQKDLRQFCAISAMVLGLSVAGSSFADTAFQSNPQNRIHFYVAGHVGVTYRYLLHKADVKTTGQADQSYRITGGEDTLADFGVRAGLILPLSHSMFMQVGPAFYETGDQHLNGIYHQESNSNPDYNFDYHVKTHRIMGELRMYYQPKKHFAMFLGGGAGMDRIKTSSFNATRAPGGRAFIPNYKGDTVNHAAFSISGGVNFPINKKLDLELGVNHVWLGSMRVQAQNLVGKYSPVDLGKLSPTTFWAEVGLHF